MVAVNKGGIFLKFIFPVKFGYKSIFIPWADITSLLICEYPIAEISPEVVQSVVKLFSEKIFRKIELIFFPDQILIVNWSPEFERFVPESINIKNGEGKSKIKDNQHLN